MGDRLGSDRDVRLAQAKVRNWRFLPVPIEQQQCEVSSHLQLFAGGPLQQPSPPLSKLSSNRYLPDVFTTVNGHRGLRTPLTIGASALSLHHSHETHANDRAGHGRHAKMPARTMGQTHSPVN